ncbi:MULTISPECIES: undecaprenyl-diphosphate phosphatase [Clostridium]|uniref:Undecaprenyl-diphosphatase n=1 Tax=Clostridium senegalense TaxID=1465809 RepID=A0A6M0H5S1_9CLOT|nr:MULTISPECIES: undecaprenyl-diphosphate phosphatase [Clostridium]NEU05999.1 undecaprenyl-diphosphate phosphatase [Clostridium senegalense]
MELNLILILKAVIIAIVEGITEFIPVSSTGHMIIVGDLINFKGNFANIFSIVIQLGAILAIVVLYWEKLFSSVKELFIAIGTIFGNIMNNITKKGRVKNLNYKQRTSIKFWKNIIVATIPAMILGLLFDDLIDKYLFNSLTVAIGLFVGGFLLLLTEKPLKKKQKTMDIDGINSAQALKVGVFQCLAMWPGMSRSSSTIIGGWFGGISTVAATEFSFFLAIPVMVGASGLKIFKNLNGITSGEWLVLAIGFLVAFIVALIVVDKFVNYLKKKPMKTFAIYRIFVSIILFVLIFTNVISL